MKHHAGRRGEITDRPKGIIRGSLDMVEYRLPVLLARKIFRGLAMAGITGSFREFHVFFIIIFASLPLGAACAAWFLGRYYKISFLRRIVAVISGWVFALCLSLPAIPLWGKATIYWQILVPVYAFFGTAAALWLLTHSLERAKFTKLFRTSALTILVISIVSFPVFALTVFIRKHPSEPASSTSIKSVNRCASILRDLYTAQELYRNQHKKYGKLDDLDAGHLFETSRFDAGITEYDITLTIPDERHWVCIAIPSTKIPNAWSLRIDETGVVRYRKDKHPPDAKDPVFR